MGHTNHSSFIDSGQIINEHLDLFWIDVVAPSNNQILTAANQIEIAISIPSANIPRFKPPIRRKLFFCFFWHTPVARENIRAFHLYTANLRLGIFLFHNGLTIITNKPNAHTGKRKPHRARPPLAPIRVRGQHDRLTHAVAFKNDMASFLLKERKRLCKQWCRTRNEKTHRFHKRPINPRIGCQPYIKCRHPHHDGRPRNKPHHRISVKLR